MYVPDVFEQRKLDISTSAGKVCTVDAFSDQVCLVQFQMSARRASVLKRECELELESPTQFVTNFPPF